MWTLLFMLCTLLFHQIRVGLTGTILQNNLEELWCVMDWWVKRLLCYNTFVICVFRNRSQSSYAL